MLIVCPSCAARYDVPERMTRAVLVMRCAGCGHEFSAQAAIAEAPPDDAVPAAGGVPTVDAPADAAAEHRGSENPDPGLTDPGLTDPGLTGPGQTDHAARPLRARIRSLLHGQPPAVLGWVASLGFLFLAGQTAIDHRSGIMQAWPPSRRLFLWLGLG